MKHISKSEGDKLARSQKDDKNCEHDWVIVDNPKFHGTQIICSKCGINKSWYDDNYTK
jgi:hydrogenase maturation factor HypF (carbamoyltransferase family)